MGLPQMEKHLQQPLSFKAAPHHYDSADTPSVFSGL